MAPARLNKHELLAHLHAIVRGVESGDSLEGHINWMLPESDDDESFTWDVVGAYRVGNLEGQGGMIVLGTPHDDQTDSA